jgi:hypothetical protein
MRSTASASIHEAPDFQIAPQVVAGLLFQPAVHVGEDHVGRDAHGRAQHQPPPARPAWPGAGRRARHGGWPGRDQREDHAGERQPAQPDRGAPGPERRVGLRAVEPRGWMPARGPELHRLAVVRQVRNPSSRDLEALALVEVIFVAVRPAISRSNTGSAAVVPRQPHDGVAAQIGKEQLAVQIMEIRRDRNHLVGQVAPVVALRGRAARRRRVDFRGGGGIGQFAAIGGNRRIDHAGRFAGKRRDRVFAHGPRGRVDQQAVDAVRAHDAEAQAVRRPLEGADRADVVDVRLGRMRERKSTASGRPSREKRTTASRLTVSVAVSM